VVWRHRSVEELGQLASTAYAQGAPLQSIAEQLLQQRPVSGGPPPGAVLVFLLAAGRGLQEPPNQGPMACAPRTEEDATIQLLGMALRAGMVGALEASQGEASLPARCEACADATLLIVGKLQVGRTMAAQGVLAAVADMADHGAVMGPVVQLLYDRDLLEEEEIVAWQSVMVAQGNKVASTKFMSDFVDWLRSASSDDASSSDDGAEVDNVDLDADVFSQETCTPCNTSFSAGNRK